MTSPKQPTADNRELETWYLEHNHWLTTWLNRRLGCPYTAADIAQDTFVKIIKARDSLLGVQQPRAFLTTTAKRLLIDRARRQVLEQNYLAEMIATSEEGQGHASPERIWQAIDALEQISRVLEGLSSKAQQAFILYYLEGKKQAEIAKELGVNQRTVRSYLVKVLVKCQELAP